MNYQILNADVQHFIKEHLHKDITKVSLAKSPFPEVSSKELAEQIDAKKRCEKKLPLWYQTEGIYFPKKLAVEQSSSEATANYKSTLISGEKLIDLTGGFGVDSYFFSRKVKQVIHCEIDSELSAIAAYNANVLGSRNIEFANQDGIQYLRETNEIFDTIYVDPSRRIKSQKVFFLRDCEPDVVNNLELLLSKSKQIIIKTSPLLDITSGLSELKHVSQVHIVSLKNDCKEILWIIDRNFSGEPMINSVALNDKNIQTLSFTLAQEKEIIISQYSDPVVGDYIYEPDAAVLKAGCFKLLTMKFDIGKVASSTHLYVSQAIKAEFIGKIYKTISVIPYKDFAKSAFRKANVITRNFPLNATEVKKKHKIEEGGDEFLLFITNSKKQLLVIHAQKQ